LASEGANKPLAGARVMATTPPPGRFRRAQAGRRSRARARPLLLAPPAPHLPPTAAAPRCRAFLPPNRLLVLYDGSGLWGGHLFINAAVVV
jgi:hypothetical protein